MDAQKKWHIKGFEYSPSLSLTHLLFVDDVVLFGIGTLEEWMAFEVILDNFWSASGMCISIDKSGFLFNELDEGVLNNILHYLPYKVDPIHMGFKYLGYFIKPLSYEVKEWRWLLKNFEKRINKWL